jgi:rhamnopyranosyl-N-acetylglucosaminyl-diphospho-decaprenol beta-1,3/1,4-galactofuranosyltransferase
MNGQVSIISDPGRIASALSVWAVVVAYDRDFQLDRLLCRLISQTRLLAGIVVVDNANLSSTAAVVRTKGATYIAAATNLGGAGGFALGMLFALAQGADLLWLWDDDGYPEGDQCLALLEGHLDAVDADLVAPMVVSDEDPSHTAFIFRLPGLRTNERAVVERHKTIDGFAHLFNGALLRAKTLGRLGLPDFRLFIRGDEVDFHLRLQRMGGRIVTFTKAVARHPSGRNDIARIPGTSFSVVMPANPDRRPVTFRNRGYIFLRHRQWRFLLTDPLRYALYFLLRRHPDWGGYRDWWAATLTGYRGLFAEPYFLARQPAGTPGETLKDCT